jgi:hypothetical protein
MILPGFSGRDVEPSGLRPGLFLAIGGTRAAPDTRPFAKSALESEGKLQSNLNGPGAAELIERTERARPKIAPSKALSQHLG